MRNKDEYSLFYNMMIDSLSTVDVRTGINSSLAELREYLKSGNIVIFAKNESGQYIQKICDEPLGDLGHGVSCIINKTSALVDMKKIYNIDLNVSPRLQNMILMNLDADNIKCIMAIINYDKSLLLPFDFWDKLKETMDILIKRTHSYEKNTRAITTDILTGVDNRNSYEMRIQELNENDNNLIYGLFDLFRLKYINDNYGHAMGDEYIKKAASVLAKYWPKNNVRIKEDGTEDITPTGHCVYRIGGDEFVLLTNKETVDMTKLKASLAATEVNSLKLPVEGETVLGLNQGVVKHEANDYIKNTYNKADALLREDKEQMYKKYQIERRR